MTTAIQTLNEKQSRNTSVQAGMNAQYGLTGNVKQTRQEILSFADDAHKDLPQYVGHWDEYELVRIVVNIKTKLGQVFRKGDVAIAKRIGSLHFGPDWTVYSIRTGYDTRLSYGVHPIE